MGLGGWVVRHRSATLGATLTLAALGAVAAMRMPVGMFPEVSFHRISLIARTANLPVEQTLTGVTQPLENALAGVLGVETIRSTTGRGGAQIDLGFAWGTEMQRSLQFTQAAVEETRPTLPAGTEIETRLLDTSAFPIVGVALTSRTRSLAEMSDLALYEVMPRLRTVPGVYRVDQSGAKIREYAVVIDPEALIGHRLDLGAVEAALRSANTIGAGGAVRDGYHLTQAITSGGAVVLEQVLDTVVGRSEGVPVTLRQIARVEPDLREDFTRASANGETAVLIGVARQPSGNAVAISADVRRCLAELARAHPDYEFSLYYDQANLVGEAVGSVRDGIAIGLVLAVATILLFIGEIRDTLVAAAVIPATVLITCLILGALGETLNLMTLGGIAAGLGLVVDDAIVVVENLHRHRQGAAVGRAVVAEAINEIAVPLVGSTLAPLSVLLPLALLGGVPGGFFQPLALTMSVALVVSLLLALGFTPALAEVLPAPRRGAPRSKARRSEDPWLARWYGGSLAWVLRHRAAAAVAGTAVVALAGAAAMHLGTGFVPEMDEGAFVLDYWSPPGTSLEETERMLMSLDEVLRETPEVSSIARRTGAELGFFLTEANRGDYVVGLRAGPRRPIDAVIDDVRRAVHDRVPALRIDFVQIMQDMIGDLSGNPSPIEVRLFGTDLPTLLEVAHRAGAVVGSTPGAVDGFDGVTRIGPTFRIDVDDERANRAGLDAQRVQHSTETAITGTLVGQVLEGDRAIPLRLRYPEPFRQRLDEILDMTLLAADGGAVPLKSIARLSDGPQAIQRTRDDLRQVIRVSARIGDRDLGSVAHDVRRRLAELPLPPGVSIEYGGLYASQQQAFRDLALVFAAATASLSLLLLFEFGSVAAVVAITVGSGLSLTGSVLALWATGTPVNVSSIVGMIMVVGIVAKNGILLIDRTQREIAGGRALSQALVEAGAVRVRPILMTSAAAAAGLLPLALGLGAGARMQQPLAIAVLGGLSLSMFFSLAGIPLLYASLSRSGRTDGGAACGS